LDDHGISADFGRLALLGAPHLPQFGASPDTSRTVGQDHAGESSPSPPALLDAVESHEFQIVRVGADPEVGDRT